MITYTKVRLLGKGVCSVCRRRLEKTLEIRQTSKDKTVSRRWCQECFEQAKMAAEHSADISR